MNVVPKIDRGTPIIALRMATVADVPALLDLIDRFFHESRYAAHLTFSREASQRYLENVIGSGMCPHIVASLGGAAIGMISYHIDRSFCVEPLAVMDEIYVIPEFAGTPVGRTLISAAMDMCRDVEHANCMHIVISSGHKRARTLVNAFKKFGAQEVGTVMRKVF